MGKSSGGKKGGSTSAERAQGAASLTEAQIALELFGQTQGLRDILFGQVGGRRGGGGGSGSGGSGSGFEIEGTESQFLGGGPPDAQFLDSFGLDPVQGLLAGPDDPGISPLPIPRTRRGGQFERFLVSGDLPPSLAFDRHASVRDTLEAQFANAREDLVARTGARGGQLRSLLARNDAERALGLGQAEFQHQLRESELKNSLFGQALSAATGLPQTSLQGLSQAAGGFGQLGAVQQQRAAQQQEATGSAAALALKAALAFL